jgi:hypothetical protein
MKTERCKQLSASKAQNTKYAVLIFESDEEEEDEEYATLVFDSSDEEE